MFKKVTAKKVINFQQALKKKTRPRSHLGTLRSSDLLFYYNSTVIEFLILRLKLAGKRGAVVAPALLPSEPDNSSVASRSPLLRLNIPISV